MTTPQETQPTDSFRERLNITADKLQATHAVIDIETLDQSRNSAVYAIGVLIFPMSAMPEDVIKEREAYVVDSIEATTKAAFNRAVAEIPKFRFLLNPLLQSGKTSVSLSTVKFGLEHNSEELLASVQTTWTTEEALLALDRLMSSYNISGLWANDPSFDCVILSNLAKAFSVKEYEYKNSFMSFRRECSMRTVRLCLNLLGMEKRTSPEKLGLSGIHNSINDCIIQAYDILRFFSMFKP